MDNSGPNVDVASELLILQLLEEELQFLRDSKHAEALQFKDALEASAGFAQTTPDEYNPETDAGVAGIDETEELIWKLYAEEVKLAIDESIAESLEYTYQSTLFVDQQLAQRLAAEERKIALDAEMSQRLQAMDDEGNVDIDRYTDVESILSPEVMKDILQSSVVKSKDIQIVEKGKGKAKATVQDDIDQEEQRTVSFPIYKSDSPSPYSNCGICLEPFQPTYAPLQASLNAASSNRVQFGLTLPCPSNHGYCVSCLTNYIQSKLDPDSTGYANFERTVFPILCPECPSQRWPSGIEDSIAERILDGSSMSAWHYQKLLESIPRLYCSNPRCSALLEAVEGVTQAVCPYCSEIMCAQCRVSWHPNLTCEEYQSIPPGDRSREDLLLLDLANSKKWRRCPKCTSFVELAFGCNHITCRCGTQFCFKCGAPWDVQKAKCSANPSCDLWDVERLLDPDAQRHPAGFLPAAGNIPRAAGAVVVQQRPVQPAHLLRPAPPQMTLKLNDILTGILREKPDTGLALARRTPLPGFRLDWMDDRNAFNTQDAWTSAMVNLTLCRYCVKTFETVAQLKNHLLSGHRGQVFACCGQFFGDKTEYNLHKARFPAGSGPGARLGRHAYEFVG